MHAKNEKLFLVVTAFVEAVAGICLLFLPNILFLMLLGVAHPTKEAIFIGRLMGAALVAIGVASWIARADARTPAQLGLLTGIFIYNVGASTLIGLAGAVLKMVGVLLWPAVALHAFLAVWCFVCLRPGREEGR